MHPAAGKIKINCSLSTCREIDLFNLPFLQQGAECQWGQIPDLKSTHERLKKGDIRQT
jgi:hypothetical protein